MLFSCVWSLLSENFEEVISVSIHIWMSFVNVLCLLCLILPVSLESSSLIAPSIYPSFYLIQIVKHIKSWNILASVNCICYISFMKGRYIDNVYILFVLITTSILRLHFVIVRKLCVLYHAQMTLSRDTGNIRHKRHRTQTNKTKTQEK
jgi:hypothetical protein